jgi:hypothetical protein
VLYRRASLGPEALGFHSADLARYEPYNTLDTLKLFTQKRVAYKILLFETTSLKLPNLLKMVSHLLLTVLTNLSRPVRNVTLNVLSRATVRYLLILL